jgi:hypothetical protein
MKRDMELIRKILLSIEATSQIKMPEIEGYSDEQIGHHIYLLMQAGYVEGVESSSWDESIKKAIPTNLTWAGHDFLAACRNDTIWNQAKEVIKSIGEDVPIEVFKSVLITVISKSLDS